jgi:hypothetical protein
MLGSKARASGTKARLLWLTQNGFVKEIDGQESDGRSHA